MNLITITTALDEIDRSLLAARIKLARQRKFPNAKAAADAIVAQHGASKSSRSYQSHESGERQPKLRDLSNYAQTFGVPLEYFVFGNHPEISDAEIQAQALLNRKKLQKRMGSAEPEPARAAALINGDKSATSGVPINQLRQHVETNTIHNLGARFIPVLSASEIRRLITGRGDLAAMSGEKLPVPPTLSASEHSYSYQIPGDDLSMMSATGASFGPGTYIVADPQAVILPGKYVLVMLDGFDEPLFRIYKAAKPYAAGVPFALQALNAAYDLITVKDAGRVQSIQRVIYTAFAV
jgi:SOS-response transcriptional repressor LexA